MKRKTQGPARLEAGRAGSESPTSSNESNAFVITTSHPSMTIIANNAKHRTDTRNGALLRRETFSASRILEYFAEKELTQQIGAEKEFWPLALTKELIDNGLDAAESTGVAPEIKVQVEPDAITVEDNGPGLPEATLVKSFDYRVRVSDKAHYVSPSRGQLGNALKCVWAAPFVVDGKHGRVQVTAKGVRHTIDVTLDRVANEPRIQHDRQADPFDGGTIVKIMWPNLAGYPDQGDSPDFYKRIVSFHQLLAAYAAFNPHGQFTLVDQTDGFTKVWERSTSAFDKWTPQAPTSAHWYGPEQFRALIGAYVGKEREGGVARTVREFVSEFAGLSGTRKQKAVTTAAGLSGAYLHDLAADGEFDMPAVERLLHAVRSQSREIRPLKLGTIGEQHFRQLLAEHWGVTAESVRFKRCAGLSGEGLPYVLEVAFGVRSEDCEQEGCNVLNGLNWSPALRTPIDSLHSLLGGIRVDPHDPVVVLVHLACPRLDFRDRGKTSVALQTDIEDALSKCIEAVGREWKKAKRQTDRDERVQQRDLEEMRRWQRGRRLSIREAAFQVMEQAYLHASGNAQYPAKPRQIMYAARPRVLKLTEKAWKQSSYFTQRLLPDYVEQHPEQTAHWDVIFDARGRLSEPHTGHTVDLGTLEVRQYIESWNSNHDSDLSLPPLETLYPTQGPANRYKFALFNEKEGFDELLKAARIAERYDIAPFSTKGMSVTASRQLVEALTKQGVTILVAHDFDKSGFSILHTLRANTRRYQYTIEPNIVDIGLRLNDVEQMKLESEPVEYEDKKDPKENLAKCGATAEEMDFLVERETYSGWIGQRVELNAMTSPQFIAWLERKLKQHGVTKLIPNEKVLASAYRHACLAHRVNEQIKRLYDSVRKEAEMIAVPKDLARRVKGKLREKLALPWDAAVAEMVSTIDNRNT